MSISKWPRIFPVSGEQDGNDTLWLKLKVRELDKQHMAVRDEGGLIIGNEVDEMKFLLPISFSETINHDWEDIDTLASKASEKFRSLSTASNQIKHIGKTLADLNSENIDLSAVADSKYRPDSPTIFKSSQKRELPLTFHLADQGDTEKDVFEPVKLLMYYSSSGQVGDIFRINYPYIFELQTITGDDIIIPLIHFNHAALTSVQPTYFGPYRNGYPTKCELTLTFKDLEPLFKNTFENEQTVLTVSSE